MKDKYIKTYIIRNKKTLEQWKAQSGKVAWASIGAAKNAFFNTYDCYRNKEDLPVELQPYYEINKFGRGYVKFDLQDIYEIVEVKSEKLISKEAMLILLKNIKSDCYVVSEENKKIIEDLLSYYN